MADALAKQDAALNADYKNLLAKLESFPYSKELLRKSQRVWIQFRDSECEFQSSQIIGGSLGIIAEAQKELKQACLLHYTYLRAEALKLAYEDGEWVHCSPNC